MCGPLGCAILAIAGSSATPAVNRRFIGQRMSAPTMHPVKQYIFFSGDPLEWIYAQGSTVRIALHLIELLSEGDPEMEWKESDCVFPRLDGSVVYPDTVSHAFADIIKRAGLPHVRLHDLRHTHATMIMEQGVSPKVVSERLGHASVAITLDTYSHVLPGLQEEVGLKFEEGMRRFIEDQPAEGF